LWEEEETTPLLARRGSEARNEASGVVVKKRDA
jgi:hypothetical protein